MSGDDYGDSIANAGSMSPDGGDTTGSLSSGDADVFRFLSSGSDTLSYRGCSTGGIPITVQVLDASGTTLDSFVNTSCSSTLRTFSIGAGVHYFRVTSTSSGGSYQLRASVTRDIDGNGTAAQAFTLATDGSMRLFGSNLSSGTDHDWYKFTLPEGRFVAFETWGLDGGADTVIEVYAPNSSVYGRTGTLDSLTDTSGGNALGHWMLTDDDGAVSALGSRVAFFAPVAGTYYVRVRPYASNTYGRYHVMFEDAGYSTGGWAAYP